MLDTLPDELLERIVAYLPSAQPIGRLSQTSRKLHRQVDLHGWRAFTRRRFPAFDFVTADWGIASRACATLVRDWDRRAFRARYLQPTLHYTDAVSGQPLKQWQRPRGQTMGFRPAIDSHECRIGSRWNDTLETLAFSAGAELLVRQKGNTIKAAVAREARSSDDQPSRRARVQTAHDVAWLSYKSPGAREGRDDITTVNIVRQHKLGPDADNQPASIIVGSANGDLKWINVSAPSKDRIVRAHFVTGERGVQSTALVQSDSHCLLATHLSDNQVTLFPAGYDAESAINPIDVHAVFPTSRPSCYIWSLDFLSPRRLAVGCGRTDRPLKVFEITPTGFSDRSSRSFTISDDALDQPTSSIFAFEPLSGRQGRTGAADIFLSGGLHGVHLHDMRSPRDVEQNYDDPTDDSAVYSLLSRGANRFMAGSSREAQVKVFDLRMPRLFEYSHVDARPVNDSRSRGVPPVEARAPWKVYINPLTGSPFEKQSTGSKNWVYKSTRGSVYSLSSPSPWSAQVFAGVEHSVVEFDFCSVVDDSALRSRKHARIKERFGEINLPMYSMESGDRGMQGWDQMGLVEAVGQPRRSGLDERWVPKS